MLDLKHLPTDAAMRVVRVTPRRDGGNIVWDIDLAMEVPDESAASTVDAYLPGAARAFSSGMEGAKGKASTTGGFDICSLRLSMLEGGQIATGHAEVRGAGIAVTQAQAVLTIKLRVHGLLDRAATAIAYQLDEVLRVSLSKQAASRLTVAGAVGLPQQQPKSSGGAVRLAVVNAAGISIAGVVVDEGSDWVSVQMIGESTPMRVAGKPTSQLEVAAPTGQTIDGIVEDYRNRCEENDAMASWDDIIVAIGRMYAGGLIAPRPDFAWSLTQDVIEVATEVASTRASEATYDA